MKSTKTPFNKMVLALTLSVSGMLLSLSALAIATDSFTQALPVAEISVKTQPTKISK
jgi:hypothetical protein